MILYIDKSQTIDCSLVISGGDAVATSQLRLNLSRDGENCYYMGEAKQNSHEWSIRIPALKNMEEGTCDMSVEVILDQYYFLVHTEQVTIKRSKPLVNFSMGSKTNTTPEETTVPKVDTETPKVKFSIKYDDDIVEKVETKEQEPINESKVEEPKPKKIKKEKNPNDVILDFDEFMENL